MISAAGSGTVRYWAEPFATTVAVGPVTGSARFRPDLIGIRNGGTARPWRLPPAVRVASGSVISRVLASSPSPRYTVMNGGNASPSFSRVVRVGNGPAAEVAWSRHVPPAGTTSGGTASAFDAVQF